MPSMFQPLHTSTAVALSNSYEAFSPQGLYLASREPRMSRKALVAELECLRMGFCTARDLMSRTPVDRVSMDAYHRLADILVVRLGGESVRGESYTQGAP